jgi:GTP pyrophosphokinase
MEMTTSVIDRLCAFHDIDKPEKFFQAIGNKNIILGDKDIDELLDNNSGKKSGWRKLVPFLCNGSKKQKESSTTDDDATDLILVDKDFNRKKTFIINDSNLSRLIFPPCCRPIPGDDILGYIDNRNHIEVHKRKCPVANKLKTSFGNHIIDAKWDMHRRVLFDATIQITGIDRIGLLNDISNFISKTLGINIRKLQLSTDAGLFEGFIELRVRDKRNLERMVEGLSKIDGVQDVVRTDI